MTIEISPIQVPTTTHAEMYLLPVFIYYLLKTIEISPIQGFNEDFTDEENF
jgi:hypothetical protein